jgi:hypothetical protein
VFLKLAFSIKNQSMPRIQRSATIHLDAPIEKAFPLFGPVREKDWAFGWDPEVICPKGALVEKHMVFRTQGGLHGSPEAYTWMIVNYEPSRGLIEYLVSASERLWIITVACIAAGSGTGVNVTYSYTALSDEAARKNEVALAGIFASDLKDWQEALNYYLATGKQLQPVEEH